jgi:hypothetical protein
MPILSPDKRFEIHLFTRDDDSYFYSSTDYYWHVTSVETGDELFSFSGNSSQDSNGSKESGVQKVYFLNDRVEVLQYDGSKNLYPLPNGIAILENGSRLRLAFSDGTEQLVPRKKLIHVSKYGQPFALPIKNDPDERSKKS